MQSPRLFTSRDLLTQATLERLLAPVISYTWWRAT